MKSVRRYVGSGDECGIDIAFKKCNPVREIGYIQEEVNESKSSNSQMRVCTARRSTGKWKEQ